MLLTDGLCPLKAPFNTCVLLLICFVCHCHLASWSSRCLAFSSKQLSGGVFGRPTFTPSVFFLGCWRLELSCNECVYEKQVKAQFVYGTVSSAINYFYLGWNFARPLQRGILWGGRVRIIRPVDHFSKIFQRLDIFLLDKLQEPCPKCTQHKNKLKAKQLPVASAFRKGFLILFYPSICNN